MSGTGRRSAVLTRRKLVGFGLGLVALGAVLTACATPAVVAPAAAPPAQVQTAPVQTTQIQTAALPVTPAQTDASAVTPAQTEGPYFKANSPERTSLVEPGMAGTRLVITGRVLTPDGQPVAGALLDFWQADDSGAYDNSGYGLRGHQFTDANGQYTLETVVPGLYPGRTRHIHVKVQAPNGPVLTTQLYFPDEARNATDGIFNAALVLPVQNTGENATATFDFVVNVA
jgi:protocatechuate 3,4-dioxygenase beta subunit